MESIEDSDGFKKWRYHVYIKNGYLIGNSCNTGSIYYVESSETIVKR